VGLENCQRVSMRTQTWLELNWTLTWLDEDKSYLITKASFGITVREASSEVHFLASWLWGRTYDRWRLERKWQKKLALSIVIAEKRSSSYGWHWW
jgi:hypothetical protein